MTVSAIMYYTSGFYMYGPDVAPPPTCLYSGVVADPAFRQRPAGHTEGPGESGTHAPSRRTGTL